MDFSMLQFNWPGILLATIAYIFISGMWHRPFAFGKPWEKAMGFERPEGWKETPVYFIVPGIACCATVVTLSILLQLAGVDAVSAAFSLGLLVGLGVAMAVSFTNATIPTMPHPQLFAIITGSAHLLGITAATLLLFTLS